MLGQSLLVKSVNLRGLGEASCGDDFTGDSLNRRLPSPRQKESRSFARKGARDSAADPASGSVDHRDFVLQHHLWSPCSGKHHTALMVQSSASISAYSLLIAVRSVTPRDWTIYPWWPCNITNG